MRNSANAGIGTVERDGDDVAEVANNLTGRGILDFVRRCGIV